MDIDALPTILDVVERISSIENSLILPNVSQIPSSGYSDEGRYCFVSERQDRSIARLMPMSQSPFRFYRGQSRYHDPCVPSLYRPQKNGKLPGEEDIAANRLKICEFALLLGTHPVFIEVAQNLLVDPVALAQHYGLTTEYLDITNCKWVAAFFACTGYDYGSDTYYPVGRDYGEGYGVMYISKGFEDGKVMEEFFDKNGVIGYQFFARPTKQSSFGFRMEMGEDFNASPYFEKVFFRHDQEASDLVFEMSYRQNRFIPKDPLSKLSRRIAESNEVTRAALSLCLSMYYPDREPAFLQRVCERYGWSVQEAPAVSFSSEELAADWMRWDEYGREELNSRLLPIIPVTTVDLGTLG